MNTGNHPQNTHLNPISLNKEQQKVVSAPEEMSILVNAYAGTGKTSVLTERIVHLINERGVDPNNILAITFTNKAANEMKKRIINRITDSRKIPHDICTIDSIFGEILREDIHKLGLVWDEDFRIMDEEDMKQRHIRSGNNHHDQKVHRENRPAITRIYNKYANIRNKLGSGEEDINDRDLNSFLEYEGYLQDKNVFDFNSVLFYAKVLMKSHEEIRKKGIKKYKYIFVDEIQDLNFIRWELIELLLEEGHSRFLGIGDLNQAIYLYNGDIVEEIFDEITKKITIHMYTTLTTNYRSSPTIIEFSSPYRTHSRKKVKFHLEKSKDHKIHRISGLNELIKLIKDDGKYSDWAILYRNNKFGNEIWHHLIENGINFRISKFEIVKNKRSNVVFLIKLMQLAFFDNWELVRDVINFSILPFEITEDIKKLMYQNKQKFIGNILENGDKLRKMLGEFKLERCCKNIEELIKFLKKLRAFPNNNLAKLAESILYLFPEIANDQKIQQFLNGIEHVQENSPFKDPMEILMNIEDVAENPKGWENVVTLSTIHAAKGLEGKNVVIINFDEFEQDHKNSKNPDKNLAYVASSRAQHNIFFLNI